MQLRVARPACRWPPHADPPAARAARDPALIAVRRAVGPRTHRTGRSAYRQSRPAQLSAVQIRQGEFLLAVERMPGMITRSRWKEITDQMDWHGTAPIPSGGCSPG